MKQRSERVRGVLLGDLRADSRLARRGLRPGDVITGANQSRVRDLGEFEAAVADARGTLYLDVLRRGREYVVRVD
jgi:S1-C subfamily serine protease